MSPAAHAEIFEIGLDRNAANYSPLTFIERAAAPNVDTMSRPKKIGVIDSPNLFGLRILVVEDCLSIISYLTDYLSELGCARPLVAVSVGEALTILETERPDAALLDMMLHTENVTPVAACLAAVDVPYAVMTGSPRKSLDHEPLLRNAFFLGKPFAYADLNDAMLGLTAPRPVRPWPHQLRPGRGLALPLALDKATLGRTSIIS